LLHLTRHFRLPFVESLLTLRPAGTSAVEVLHVLLDASLLIRELLRGGGRILDSTGLAALPRLFEQATRVLDLVEC